MSTKNAATTGFPASDRAPGAGHHQLLLGPGERLASLAGVLGALSPDRSPARVLGDLAELFTLGAGPGTLLLDCDALPPEDLGIARRFAGRPGGWTVVLVGSDPRTRVARGLSALGASRWLPWPPDLDQLRALASGAAEPDTPGDALADLEHAVARLRTELAADPPAALLDAERALARLRGDAPPAEFSEFPAGDLPDLPPDEPAAPVDLCSLLEETLAGVAVGGADVPRFLYRPKGELPVAHDRESLSNGLEEVFQVARSCAGQGSVVRVDAAAVGDGVALELEFPAPALAAALQESDEVGARGLPEGDALLAALGHLRSAGTRVGLEPDGKDRVTVSVALSAASPAPLA
jgi:hypothetical protein